MSQDSSKKLQMVGMEETSVKNEVLAGVRQIAVLVPSDSQGWLQATTLA